jgi:hypothetical protein
MSKAFGTNKRVITGTERAKDLKDATQYKFAKELAKKRCEYVENRTINKTFTIGYHYTNDSLVGEIRNVDSYETLQSLSRGHNICDCESTSHNVRGDMSEFQSYGFQDLSGITLYNSSGNKLFDDFFFSECGDLDYTKYNSANLTANRQIDQTLYLSNYSFPQRVPLYSEYVKPQIIINTLINSSYYTRSITPNNSIILKTVIDECFNKSYIIDTITAKLYQQIVLSTTVTNSNIYYNYGIIESPQNIFQGTLLSSPLTSNAEFNEFTILEIHKPGINYFIQFTNTDVPDICSSFINIYGAFKNLKGVGFDNSIISNAIFTDTETQNQGATSSQVVFSPTIAGDFFYQSDASDSIYGQINIADASSGHTDISHNYYIDLRPRQGSAALSQYYLTVSADPLPQAIQAPTISAYTGDTIIFEVSGNLTTQPLYIQTTQGKPSGTTEVLDASNILGKANTVLNDISMQIMDSTDKIFSVADNTIRIKIDPTTNNYNADLSGTIIKPAINGIINFNDLKINKPKTGYKFVFYTDNGEITEYKTSAFDVRGELQAITTNATRRYLVGETFNNIGAKILSAEDDNTTKLSITISNGTLGNTGVQTIDNSVNYTNAIQPEISGNTYPELTTGEKYVDISINHVGFNYNLIFDASNTIVPLLSDNFDIISTLDISNHNYSSSDLSFIAGTDLSNIVLSLLDYNSNQISLNSFATAVIKQQASNGTISTVSTSALPNNIRVLDGSASLSDISINRTGLNFFIETSAIHGDASKNSQFIDIYADIDISSQPLLTANRIVGRDYDNVMISFTDINGENIADIQNITVTSTTTDILNGTKTETTNSSGIAEFDNITFFKGTDDLTYKEHRLEFSQASSETNLRPIITESFNILYTNWDAENEKQVAPGINTIDGGEYYIQLDQDYRAKDNSYVLLDGQPYEANSKYWKINTTGETGGYMRTFIWTISGDIDAGSVMRIQRKFYTDEALNILYNSNADFSFVPLYETLQARTENRTPRYYYYDYSFNLQSQKYTTHVQAANDIPYDTAVYDTSWGLTTIRSQAESDMLSKKIKQTALANENDKFFVGANMTTPQHYRDSQYGHVLYKWDASGETEHHIWAGVKTIVLTD